MRETYMMGGVEILTGASKRVVIKEYGEKYGLKHLVETGTYFGEVAQELHPYFDLIETVEVFKPLYDQAVEKFADNPKVLCFLDDSAEFVERLAPSLTEPVLWYLDAHSSGPESGGDASKEPLTRELKAIFANPPAGTVVLIDDARLLGNGTWPSIEDVKTIAAGWTIEVTDDVIRVTK